MAGLKQDFAHTAAVFQLVMSLCCLNKGKRISWTHPYGGSSQFSP